jgi:hypothetical protein
MSRRTFYFEITESNIEIIEAMYEIAQKTLISLNHMMLEYKEEVSKTSF